MDNNNKWLILQMDLPPKATVNITCTSFLIFLVNYRQISFALKKTLATNTKGKKRGVFPIKIA
jgi:hypothetical protein